MMLTLCRINLCIVKLFGKSHHIICAVVLFFLFDRSLSPSPNTATVKKNVSVHVHAHAR